MTAAYSRSPTLAAYQSAAAHGGVAAADPHRLIVMLMDGALDRIAQAKGHIERGGDPAEKNRALHIAVSIVEELRASLDLKAGGTIAANLDDLYDYICRRLIQGNLRNEIKALDEAANLLKEIRMAWTALPEEARASRAASR